MAVATSAAKLLSFFSTPSPSSKRRNPVISIAAPAPFAAAAGDHQSANARALADAGAALLRAESTLDPETLARDMQAILTDPARARAMASAALSLARPDAARRLYDLVTEIA